MLGQSPRELEMGAGRYILKMVALTSGRNGTYRSYEDRLSEAAA
jgi:hypothetical protein